MFRYEVSKKYSEDCCLCPNCQFVNIKDDRKINDIDCEKCSIHYCFICNKILLEQGEKNENYLHHFEVSNCYYKDLSLK